MARPPKEKNIQVNPLKNSNTEFDELAWSEAAEKSPVPVMTFRNRLDYPVSIKEETLFSYYSEFKRLSSTGNLPEITKLLYKLFGMVHCGSYLFEMEDLLKFCKVFGLNMEYVLNTINDERKAFSELKF